jgi:hypothetical protein
MDLKADDLAWQRAEVARLESELIAATARLYTTLGTTPSTLLLRSWLLWDICWELLFAPSHGELGFSSAGKRTNCSRSFPLLVLLASSAQLCRA